MTGRQKEYTREIIYRIDEFTTLRIKNVNQRLQKKRINLPIQVFSLFAITISLYIAVNLGHDTSIAMIVFGPRLNLAGEYILSFVAPLALFFGIDVLLRWCRRKLEMPPGWMPPSDYGDGTMAWVYVFSTFIEALVILIGCLIHGYPLTHALFSMFLLSIAYLYFVIRHGNGGKRKRKSLKIIVHLNVSERLRRLAPQPM